MANHNSWFFCQRACNDTVNFLSNAGSRRVKKHIARKPLQCDATHSSTVLVQRAQNRLNPLPIERAFWLGVNAILKVDLLVGDAAGSPHGFGNLGLKNEKFVIDVATLSLNVRGQRYVGFAA